MQRRMFLNIILVVVNLIFVNCVYLSGEDRWKRYEQKADSLIKLMTLEEKVGQLNLITANMATTGINKNDDFVLMIKRGQVGAILNAYSVEYLTKLQKIAVEETRLHIPLIFGLDVVNGFKTIFPIPLAQACSWDMNMIERIERVAAIEASAAGVNWTFAPMVDISRDPRWGRVSECPGEDTWLATKIAQARVRGFQGTSFDSVNTIIACAKHFAAYGAPVGGRDYNAVDMSLLSLFEWYLPTYKACVDAGVGSVMTSFNEIAGTPSTCNRWLLTDILKNSWKFDGFVVSDYTAIHELIAHGVAENDAMAAYLSINAGTDMDMVSLAYLNYLPQLVKEGKVSEKTIDNAVKRILMAKYKLGLFDNPYKYLNKKREETWLMRPEYLQLAREAAAKSCVLLKNEGNILPLKKNISSIAVIGPLAKNNNSHGSNGAAGSIEIATTLYDGIKSKMAEVSQIHFAQGCNINDGDTSMFYEAYRIASQANVVVLALGEDSYMTGESKSRTDLTLPGVQLQLAKRILTLGKPTIVVLFGGRPLVITELAQLSPAIIMAWLGGTQAGAGIADVIFGDYNPSGKLVMTFPRTVGQIPVYYNMKNTGRPVPNPDQSGIDYHFLSRYIDSPNAPLYPFGYGLSYTTFQYSPVRLNKQFFSQNDTIVATIEISNIGNYDGEEIVQLYIHDKVAEVTRPIKELKGFQKIFIKKGETKKVTFFLTVNDLAYYHSNLNYTWDPGEFELFIGPNSNTSNKITFTVE